MDTCQTHRAALQAGTAAQKRKSLAFENTLLPLRLTFLYGVKCCRCPNKVIKWLCMPVSTMAICVAKSLAYFYKAVVQQITSCTWHASTGIESWTLIISWSCAVSMERRNTTCLQVSIPAGKFPKVDRVSTHKPSYQNRALAKRYI